MMFVARRGARAQAMLFTGVTGGPSTARRRP